MKLLWDGSDSLRPTVKIKIWPEGLPEPEYESVSHALRPGLVGLALKSGPGECEFADLRITEVVEERAEFRWNMNDLDVREIYPNEVKPDLSLFLDALRHIPPEKRMGTVTLPNLIGADPAKPVQVRFWEPKSQDAP